jgi:hypothetical protein
MLPGFYSDLEGLSSSEKKNNFHPCLIIALEATQPLTEMSTGNLPWGGGGV